VEGRRVTKDGCAFRSRYSPPGRTARRGRHGEGGPSSRGALVLVAKLESGRIKNLGVRTLLKCATALGGRVTLRIEAQRSVTKGPRARAHRRVA
jgi:hypothetical protein